MLFPRRMVESKERGSVSSMIANCHRSLARQGVASGG